MRILSVILPLALTAPALSAVAAEPDTPTQAQPAQPHIQFASTTFDFGKIKSGDIVRHDFIFTNTGTATLEVTNVRPGCGCTTAGNWDHFVEPGKTGAIPLQFNSGSFNGTIQKTATVSCNDPRQTNVLLQLSGTIWRPIDVIPGMAMFSALPEGQTNETKVVRIISNLEEMITLSELQCSNASFQVELKTVRPGKEFEVQITAVPPFVGPTVYGPVTIKTSSKEVPEISFSAYVTVQPVVVAVPQQLAIGPAPLASKASFSVTLQNNGTNALKLSNVRVDAPGVEVAVQEPEPGRRFRVGLTFPAGFQIQPGQRVALIAETDHPKSPSIQVPIFHSQPPPVGAAFPVANAAVAAATAVSPPPAPSVVPTMRAVPTRAGFPPPAGK